MKSTHAFRQIHLDFHTGPDIPGVGEQFDAEEFGEILQKAGVESVTLFAKCHHGHLYYETPRAERHPHLCCDLLPQQIQELRRRGIRCPIYLSILCDEFAARTHPEWLALNPDGAPVSRRPFSNECFSWTILDMASPYAGYLEDQLADVLERFCPVDGIFLDMCWDQPSASRWAIERMQVWGLDPRNTEDCALYARRLSHEYMARYAGLIESRQRDVPVWFNSRPLVRIAEEKRWLKHIEVEALPTGAWGYGYFPTHIRLVKPMGLPMVGMTGRFHKSWADFGGLRTVPSLLYDCAQALAHGAACSIGDQLHPSGKMDRAVYEVIGSVYEHVKHCEPFVRRAVTPKEIAVLFADPAENPQAELVHEGVRRMLAQLHYQFVFVLPDDAWEEYPLVIIPETITPGKSLQQRISSHLQNGGTILQEDLTGESSPYSVTYLRFDKSVRGRLPEIDHVFYEPGIRLLPREGDVVLAQVVEPYFERSWQQFCSHAQTPPRLECSSFVAGVVRGNRALFALPIFRAYAKHANLPCRQLAAAALERLIPEPLLRLEGPSYLEAVVTDDALGRRVVHLLSFLPEKRSRELEMIEEAVPARNVTLDLRINGNAKAVTLQPEGEDVAFTSSDGRTLVSLDWVEGHQMLVVET